MKFYLIEKILVPLTVYKTSFRLTRSFRIYPPGKKKNSNILHQSVKLDDFQF